MRVVTVATNPDDHGLSILKTSCALKELKLDILLCSESSFSGNRKKDELLLRHLRSLDGDEIILFTDAYDTFFLAGEAEILQKYQRIGKELLFSAETGCWPDRSLAASYPPIESGPYKYLNCGGFMGPAKAVIEFTLANESRPGGDYGFSNQYQWTRTYIENPDRIGLDTNCEVFCTFFPEDPTKPKVIDLDDPVALRQYYDFAKKRFESNFTIENGRIFSRITGTWICHAHFNGRSKVLIKEDIAETVYCGLPNYANITTFNFANRVNIQKSKENKIPELGIHDLLEMIQRKSESFDRAMGQAKGQFARLNLWCGEAAGRDADIYALSLLQPLLESAPMLPFTNSALRPYCAAHILNDIMANSRKAILEFGAGVSTVLMARLARRNGIDATIISVEHDGEWLEAVAESLRKEGLQEAVKLVHAPLEPCQMASATSEWYGEAALREALAGLRFDLVIVDGPPAYQQGKGEARYPALPFVRDALAESCSLYLDDANREGERSVLKKWELESAFRFRLVGGSLAFASAGRAFNVVPM